MKLNEVLKSVFTNAGINISEENTSKILDSAALATIEVEEGIASTLTAPRLSLEAAKNNPDLIKHFKATILNGVDNEIERTANEFGLTDEDKTDIKLADSSFKRISVIANKIAKLTEQKVGASKKDKEGLTKDIEALNAQIINIKKEYADKESKLLADFDNERMNYKLDGIYNQFIPKMDERYSADINTTIAKTTVAKALQSKGLKIKNIEGNLTIVNAEDAPYFENNNKVGVEDFVSKTLANEKLLNATSKVVSKQPTTPRTSTTTTNNGLNSSKAVAELEAMIGQ